MLLVIPLNLRYNPKTFSNKIKEYITMLIITGKTIAEKLQEVKEYYGVNFLMITEEEGDQ
jgi:hypothetical protein